MNPHKSLPSKVKDLDSKLPADVIFHPSTEGGFWVESPDLQGCFAQGDTLYEASINFKEAVFDYFDIPRGLQKSIILSYQSENLFEGMKSRKEPIRLVSNSALSPA
jgi:predicted RNase H-like HicB family nuclease